MRVLSYDPGALRQGWAVLQETLDKPKLIASSYVKMERGEGKQKLPYQTYRLRLLSSRARHAADLIETYKPDRVACEIVPPTGFGNSGGAIQAQLALASIDAVQTVAIIYEVPLIQIGATTMKKAMTGVGDASKVRVRDGVLGLLPELEVRRHEWVGKGSVFEEIDAIGVGLTALGYTN